MGWVGRDVICQAVLGPAKLAKGIILHGID